MKLKAEALQFLSNLSVEELREVRNVVDATLGGMRERVERTPLLEALEKQFGYSLVTYGEATISAWAKKSPAAEKFVRETFNPKTRLGERALCTLLIQILVEDIRQRGISVTMRIVIEHLGRLPEVFEVQFPGYIKAGLASIILQKLTGGKDGKHRQTGSGQQN